MGARVLASHSHTRPFQLYLSSTYTSMRKKSENDFLRQRASYTPVQVLPATVAQIHGVVSFYTRARGLVGSVCKCVGGRVTTCCCRLISLTVNDRAVGSKAGNGFEAETLNRCGRG